MGHPMDDVDRLESENHGLRDLVASIRAENAALRELLREVADAPASSVHRSGTGVWLPHGLYGRLLAAAKPAENGAGGA